MNTVLPCENAEVEALRASEVRYRRLFESARDGVLILDADTGMVVDVNPFLIQLLGLTHEDFLHKEVWDLGLFKNIAANEARFAELQAKDYVRYEDLPLETTDGRKIEVEFVSNVYLVNGQDHQLRGRQTRCDPGGGDGDAEPAERENGSGGPVGRRRGP